MKNIILFVLAASIAIAANAQQSVFSNVAIQQIHHRQMMQFTAVNDVNVRHYRIEAGKDSINFEVIAVLPSKGNNMKAVSYSYDLSAQSYNYYRVAKVEMNGNMPYSAVVTNTSEEGKKPFQKIITAPGSADMVANK